MSPRGRCNTKLRPQVLPSGRTVLTCHRCAWREAGRCWSCGAPRTNHPTIGVYCEPCRKAALELSVKRAQSCPDYREKSWSWAVRTARDPHFVEKRRAYLREWRKKNPEKVKAAWARYAAKRNQQRKAA